MISLRAGEPLVIQTPLGRITIERIVTTKTDHRGNFQEDRRKLKVRMPRWFHLARKRERIKESEFILEEADSIRPRFHLLGPVVDEQGNLIGVREPRVLKISGD